LSIRHVSAGNEKEKVFVHEAPVLLLLSPGMTLLTLSLVQEWLDMRNATFVAYVQDSSALSGS